MVKVVNVKPTQASKGSYFYSKYSEYTQAVELTDIDIKNLIQQGFDVEQDMGNGTLVLLDLDNFYKEDPRPVAAPVAVDYRDQKIKDLEKELEDAKINMFDLGKVNDAQTIKISELEAKVQQGISTISSLNVEIKNYKAAADTKTETK